MLWDQNMTSSHTNPDCQSLYYCMTGWGDFSTTITPCTIAWWWKVGVVWKMLIDQPLRLGRDKPNCLLISMIWSSYYPVLKLCKLLRLTTLIVDYNTNWLCREISCFGSGRHAVWPLPRERAEVSTVIPGPSLALSNDQGRCVKQNSVREKVTSQ